MNKSFDALDIYVPSPFMENDSEWSSEGGRSCGYGSIFKTLGATPALGRDFLAR